MPKRICVALLLSIVALTGCNGVVHSASEKHDIAMSVADMDARQLADDWSLLWLANRQYRLTRYTTR